MCKLSFHAPASRQVSLTAAEENYILSALPRGTEIASAEYFDNYNLPCPIKVMIRLQAGTGYVVLRKARHGNVDTEATILDALAKRKLPVPSVIAKPETNEQGEAMCLLSFLPGCNLQKLSMISRFHREVAKRLLIDAVGMLTAITGSLRDSFQDLILTRTLRSHFTELVEQNSPWLSDPLCQEALGRIETVVKNIRTPLVFTNGDYQPANYLVENARITGLLDFEKASFQDPLLGWAKYPIDDLHPLNKGGVVAAFLKENGFSREDFAPRLALGALMKLCNLPIEAPPEDQDYQLHIMSIIRGFCEGSTDLFDT